jgi:hypothetical protein
MMSAARIKSKIIARNAGIPMLIKEKFPPLRVFRHALFSGSVLVDLAGDRQRKRSVEDLFFGEFQADTGKFGSLMPADAPVCI